MDIRIVSSTYAENVPLCSWLLKEFSKNHHTKQIPVVTRYNAPPLPHPLSRLDLKIRYSIPNHSPIPTLMGFSPGKNVPLRYHPTPPKLPIHILFFHLTIKHETSTCFISNTICNNGCHGYQACENLLRNQ